jgi:hypothetical protein
MGSRRSRGVTAGGLCSARGICLGRPRRRCRALPGDAGRMRNQSRPRRRPRQNAKNVGRGPAPAPARHMPWASSANAKG